MKRQTSRPNLILLLTATVITWTSCHPPVPPPEEHPICYPGKHVIPDSTAGQYQMRFINAYDTLKKIVPASFLAHHFRIPNAETFSREAICALIYQHGVDSVRIFYGEDSTGGFRLMLKGVDHKGNIVVIRFPKPGVSNGADSTTNMPQDDGGDALENGQTCPPCMVDGPPPPSK